MSLLMAGDSEAKLLVSTFDVDQRRAQRGRISDAESAAQMATYALQPDAWK